MQVRLAMVLAIVFVLEMGDPVRAQPIFDVTPPPPVPSLRQPPDGMIVNRPPTRRSPYYSAPYAESLVPEFEPTGVSVGAGLKIYPSITGLLSYDSNVFGLPSGEKSDGLVTIAPELIGIKRTSRNILAFEANAEVLKYLRFHGLDAANVSMGVGDAYEIAPSRFVTFGGAYEFIHLDPEFEETVARSPTEVHVASGQLGYLQEAQRLGFRVDLTANHYDFLPLKPLSGAQVDQSDRNYSVAQIAPELFYELTPNYIGFARLTGNLHWYDRRRDAAAFRRDSYGGTADFGLIVQFTRTLFADVFAGALYQKYLDPRFGDIAGPNFGADAVWVPSDSTRLALRVVRTIEETRTRALDTPQNFSAMTTRATASIDHTIFPNLLLHVSTGGSVAEFTQTDREDKVIEGKLELRYFLSRFVYMGPEIGYAKRYSDERTARFERLLALFRGTAQF